MITPNVVLSPEDIQDNLETLIDKTSANFVLNCIVQIAHGKADHLRENWQDENTQNPSTGENAAKQWEKLASKLETLADKPEFETL